MWKRELLNYETIRSSEKSDWVVMIHGAGGSVKTWKYQLDDLSKHFNLLIIDLRDHGLSKYDATQAPDVYSFDLITQDIKDVMDHLVIERSHFVSLSLGSAMIQHFMMKYPETVNKAVFAGGIFKASVKLRAAAYVAKVMNYMLPYRLMYRLFSFIAMPKKRNQKARQIFIKQAEKLTAKEYGKWIGLESSFFKILKQSLQYPFHHQSLVVMGQEDYVFTDSAKKYAEDQKYASYVEISKAGHICNIEKPKEFNTLVINFLNDQKSPLQKPESKALS